MKVTRQPFDPGPAAWNEILPAAPQHPQLSENQSADVVVIGAGFAGLSAARRLNQLDPSLRVVVLDARRVAEGPAGRNSGFMIDLPHKLASKDYAGGKDDDRLQTALNREAIAFAQEAADALSMPVEAFSISGKINAAASAKGMQHNRDYADHLASLDEPYELLDAHAMAELSGSAYYQNGLFTPGTAMIQPALYVRTLAEGLRASGVEVFENSPVTGLQRSGSGWRVQTPLGNVSAAHVILATNGHAESFGQFKRQLMHVYLYASMTRALTVDEVGLLGGQPNWGFTPADPMGTTVRRISGTGGDRLVVRNSVSWAPGRTVSGDTFRRKIAVHRRSFHARFPKLKSVPMEYEWGGLLCLSRNTVPAFGERDQGLYAACCQNGLGTASGTLSGKLIAELVMGHPSASLDSYLAYPEPQRLPMEPLASIGARMTLRWGEYKAGAEL